MKYGNNKIHATEGIDLHESLNSKCSLASLTPEYCLKKSLHSSLQPHKYLANEPTVGDWCRSMWTWLRIAFGGNNVWPGNIWRNKDIFFMAAFWWPRPHMDRNATFHTHYNDYICNANVLLVNTWRSRRNDRHLADDHLFSWMKIYWCEFKFHWSFFPKGPINNIPALDQIMAWRQPGDKPLSDPRMFSLMTHIWVTRPQWVNKRHWEIGHFLRFPPDTT